MKTTKRLTSSEIKELKQLGRVIEASYCDTASLVWSSKDIARAALAEAIIFGHAACRAKGILGHDAFSKWLRESHKNINERTAQNYMHVATPKLLSTDLGLNHAYKSLGILTE